MQCPNCKEPVTIESKYCEECGASLSALPDLPITASEGKATPQKSRIEKKSVRPDLPVGGKTVPPKAKSEKKITRSDLNPNGKSTPLKSKIEKKSVSQKMGVDGKTKVIDTAVETVPSPPEVAVGWQAIPEELLDWGEPTAPGLETGGNPTPPETRGWGAPPATESVKVDILAPHRAESSTTLIVAEGNLTPERAEDAIPCICGAGSEKRDSQGFCSECGRKSHQNTREHKEFVLGTAFAAISDKGRRHAINEDDLMVSTGDIQGLPIYVLVICDGLSSAYNAQIASTIASQTACASLLETVHLGEISPNEALRIAIRRAHEAVCEMPYPAGTKKDPPSTTIVAAIVQFHTVTIGWVGDTRAYCLAGEKSELLTHDHSWVNEQVDAGLMTEEEAMQTPYAHAITRCLGDGGSEDPECSVVTVVLPEGFNLLLCSDGLWNYASTPMEVMSILENTPPDTDTLSMCRTLVDFANARGGRDNITVAMLKDEKTGSGE